MSDNDIISNILDVNSEAEKSLAGLDCTVVYSHPDSCCKMPAVTFYTLTELNTFSTDNEAGVLEGHICVDVWSRKAEDCGRYGIEVNKVLTSDGWVREFSQDMPKEDGVYHKTMRFVKEFVIGGTTI